MRERKRKQAGITLIALVISIIIMLILAGVSLNAMVGENGIITMAQQAKTESEVSSQLENLQMELMNLSTDELFGGNNRTISELAQALVDREVLDSIVKTSTGNIAAGIDPVTKEKYFFGVKGQNTYKILVGTDGILNGTLSSTSSGGEITGGTALITAENFNSEGTGTDKGKYSITSDAEVVFMDTISGYLSIYVAEGVHATVGIYAPMTLTNRNIARSAIDIEKGGILDLYIDDGIEVTVNSGYGESGENASGLGAKGGPGGYAGIHVPWTDTNENGELDEEDSYAVLNLYGGGIIKAYGGNAGKGGGDTGSGNTGGGRRWSEQEQVLDGNGGQGGSANASTSPKTKDNGHDGEKGENCGKVNIYNSLTVYAYGGAGGGANLNRSGDSGGGGGGYPAAGIGGGGAGRWRWNRRLWSWRILWWSRRKEF